MEGSVIGAGVSGLLSLLIGYLIGAFQKQNKDYKAIKHGLQALLRNSMIDAYNEAMRQGYTTLAAKQNFDNLYNNYHALGLNGVMDNIHDEYIKLEVKYEKDIT